MEKNRPVYSVVIGSIRLAIWENAVAPAEGKIPGLSKRAKMVATR